MFALASTFVVALFVAHAASTVSQVVDDAFIALRYARNLARGAGLVYNAGERVEGYTCFSWVVIAAALVRLGHEPVRVVQVVGTLLGAATFPLPMDIR